MNTAILLSGGTGSRLHSDIPKQYIEVGGKMVLAYSLETLVNAAAIDAVFIVADPAWREKILHDAERHGIPMDRFRGFAAPGVSRQASILNGLQSIHVQKKVNEEDAVLIHDAARPLLSVNLIEACFLALKGHDGVMPVLPMKDTVYFSQDGSQVTELLDRSRIYAGQAPELFRLEKYYQANIALLPERINKINGSTEPAIMAGMDVVMIPGEEANFKITTNADLERFRDICGQTQ